MRLPRIIGLCAFASLLLPALSHAYEFVPTVAEFYAWPSYCQAKYVTTPIGEASRWARSITHDQIDAARLSIGDAVFLHIHHYCAGYLEVARAKRETVVEQRKSIFNAAVADLSYVADRIPATSPLMANVLFSLADAYQGLGDPDSALTTLTSAVDAHPEIAGTHVALALFLRSKKDLPGARKALEQGISAVGDGSAELDYDLGLICLEMRDSDEAVKYARRAYELGYPLPGLRDKLIRLGAWKEPAAADIARK